MELIDAMNELAARIGMGPVVADETGGFTLSFDGEHEVSFAPDGDGTVLLAEVGEAAALDRGGLLSLLEASLLGAETGGAAFGVHRALGTVVLWKRYGEFSVAAELERALHEFLGLAIEWKRRLAAGETGAASGEATPAPGLGGHFLQV